MNSDPNTGTHSAPQALASAAQAQADPAAALRALLGAAAALREGLQNSPHNAPLLLALVGVYSLLCAGSAAHEARRCLAPGSSEHVH